MRKSENPTFDKLSDLRIFVNSRNVNESKYTFRASVKTFGGQLVAEGKNRILKLKNHQRLHDFIIGSDWIIIENNKSQTITIHFDDENEKKKVIRSIVKFSEEQRVGQKYLRAKDSSGKTRPWSY